MQLSHKWILIFMTLLIIGAVGVAGVALAQTLLAGYAAAEPAERLAFLQDLYRRINQEGHTQAAVTCPHCSTEFTVDIAGDASGES